ncbi:hypothetical protein PENTCL1PPCAC_21189, partial [Pristionchus entomophagus]
VLLSYLFCGSDAYFRFNRSVLIDETDIIGKETFDVPILCDVDCRVYISVPKSSLKTTARMLIGYLKNFNMGFNYIATKTDNGEKYYWHVWDPRLPQLTIYNKNKNLEVAPFLVWVVQVDHANNVRVFDANDVNYHILDPKIDVVTVMSTEPFTLSTITTGKMTMVVTASGFDTILYDGEDECQNVLKLIDPSAYPEVDLWSNGPLLTLSFDRDTQSGIGLGTKVGDASIFSLDTPSFITSPGYISCEAIDLNSARTFRSSLYPTQIEYQFESNSATNVVLSAEIDVAEDDAVIVENKGSQYTWFGTNEKKSQELKPNGLTISWNRTEMEKEERFLIQIEPVNQGEDSTTSEPEPAKTTIAEPEPVRTTAAEPEPEKTTVAEP